MPPSGSSPIPSGELRAVVFPIEWPPVSHASSQYWPPPAKCRPSKPASCPVSSRLSPLPWARRAAEEELTKSICIGPFMPPNPRIRASVPEPSLTPGAQKSVPVECLRATEWLRGAAPGEGGRRAAHSSGGGEAVNVAVAVASPPRLSVQSPLPEAPPPLQAPPQPAKLKSLPAVAVSVTEVPAPKSAAQVDESQSSPEGEEVTRPFPWTMTVRRCWPGGGVLATNVALTSRSASSVRSHPPVPLQAPAQLMKDAPESGTATRWTCEPVEYWALQFPRQSAPAPRTSPLPDVVRRRLTLVGSVRPDPPPELDPHPATTPAPTQTRMNARIASPTSGNR